MSRHVALIRQTSGLGLCLLVSLFMSGARFHDKPLSPVNTAMAYENRSLSDIGLTLFLEKHKQSPQAAMGWDLPALTLVAIYYHPDLDVARARWKTTKGSIDAAGDRPGETFSTAPRYNVNSPAGKTPWYLQLESGFVFETAGKRRHRMSQARHTAEAARFNVAQTAWQARSRLRSSLVATLAAQKRKAFLSAQLTAQEDMAHALERRLALEEASQIELTQSRITAAQTRLTLTDMGRMETEGLAQTAQALGIPVDALKSISLASEWFDDLTDTQNQVGWNLDESGQNQSRLLLREEALLGRADISALMEEYAASQAALQLAISRQYPDVRIGPGYLWNQGERFWTLPATLSFANRLGSQGAIHDAKARRDEVATRFMALQAIVIGDVDRTYLGYQQALKRLMAANALLVEQQGRHAAIQKQFDLGEIDRVTLRLSQVEFNTAQISRIDALERAQLSLGLLEDAIQRPLKEQRPNLPSAESNPRLGEQP